MTDPTAAAFEAELRGRSDPDDAAQLQRYFKTGPGEYGEGDRFLGVRMSAVSAMAKRYRGMPLGELETLLDSGWHECRAGALTIMDAEARSKRLEPQRRTALFDLYLRRHDRINNWDLVDCACRSVLGIELLDKPRDVLYRLAASTNLWERRTAIVTCWTFIRAGQTDDAIAISELLLQDAEDLIHKATGWMLRTIGDVDRPVLLAFLEQHAATMPRTTLRYAIEKLPPDERKDWLGRRALARE